MSVLDISPIASFGLRAPTEPVEVDWGNERTNGLIGCYLCSGPSMLKDLVGIFPPIVTLAGSPFVSNKSNPGIGSYNTNMTAYSSFLPTNFWYTGNMTLFWYGRVDGVPSSTFNEAIFGFCTTAGMSDAYTLYNSKTVGPLLVWNNAGTQVVVNGAVVPTAGKDTSIAGVYVPGGATNSTILYTNGKQDVTGTFSGAPTWNATPAFQVCIGHHPKATSSFSNTTTYIALIYNRALTAAEIWFLHNNPFSVLRSQMRHIWSAYRAPFCQQNRRAHLRR